jgi:chromate transporter
MDPTTASSKPNVSLREYLLYFLKLGATGFGGPIALVGHMQRDLVEKKGWVSEATYKEGLALAQLSPGPLAAQLAIYLGWARAGVGGAALVGLAFVLPSFLMVVVLAILYIHFGGLPWIQKWFYGIGAVVIAIILNSAVKLVKKTVGNDVVLWIVWGCNAFVTAWTSSEIFWLFLFSGFAVMAWRAMAKAKDPTLLSILPIWMLTGLSGTASLGTLSDIAVYFTKAGAFVFGSGLAIVPFLYGGVVQQYHWLSERQFLDAVAVAMITPGPVVITVGFIGYLVAGFAGAATAAGGTFLPCFLFTILPAPYFHKIAKNKTIQSFVDGVTAAAIGSIAGAVFVLGRKAIVDIPTMVLLVVACVLLFKVKKVPEPLLILLGGVAGFILKSSIF